MACSSYNNTNPQNCGSNIDIRGEGGEGTGCVSNWDGLSERGYGFCEFATAGGCTSVCGCNYVWRCYSDCSNYTEASSTPRDITNNNSYVGVGDLIKASDFSYLVSSLNSILDTLKYNIHLSKSYNIGNVISSNDLKPILTTYNSPFTGDTADVPARCNSTYASDPILSTNMVDSGIIITAYEWNNVYRHLQYLSTCCHCVSDYVLVCSSVCNCACYY